MTMELYYVAICKDGEVLYAVAGPFYLWDQAEEVMGAMEEPYGRCYHAVVKTEVEYRIMP